MNIIQAPSPNFFGRSGYNSELLVIHCTDGNWDTDKEWLRTPASQVSAHFVISPDGGVYQLVAVENAAWHAGRVNNPTAKLKKNATGGFINPNFYAIGVEVSLKSTAVMPQLQNDALVQLVKFLTSKYKIPIDRDHIVGHREIYSLKTCPGTIDVEALVQAVTPPHNTNEKIKAQIIALVKKIK